MENTVLGILSITVCNHVFVIAYDRDSAFGFACLLRSQRHRNDLC